LPREAAVENISLKVVTGMVETKKSRFINVALMKRLFL